MFVSTLDSRLTNGCRKRTPKSCKSSGGFTFWGLAKNTYFYRERKGQNESKEERQVEATHTCWTHKQRRNWDVGKTNKKLRKSFQSPNTKDHFFFYFFLFFNIYFLVSLIPWIKHMKRYSVTDVGWKPIAHPDSYDVDLHSHQQSIQDH